MSSDAFERLAYTLSHVIDEMNHAAKNREPSTELSRISQRSTFPSVRIRYVVISVRDDKGRYHNYGTTAQVRHG
jgi:hypothetical protein